jgi:hypothetical protein
MPCNPADRDLEGRSGWAAFVVVGAVWARQGVDLCPP